MQEFMAIWSQIKNYRDMHLGSGNLDYSDYEKAFREEKKIAITYEADEVKEFDVEEPDYKRIMKKE